MNDKILSFEEWQNLQKQEMEYIFKIMGESSKPAQPNQGKLVILKGVKQ